MNYTTLVADKSTAGSIKYRINYGSIDSEGILQQAQTDIFTSLRTREMLKITTLDVSDGDTSVVLPSDWLGPRSMKIRGYHPLKLRTPDKLEDYRVYNQAMTGLAEGIPQNVFLIGDNLEFEVEADADYTVDTLYFAQPALLASDNLTNFLTDKFQGLLINKILELAYDQAKEWTASDRYNIKFERKLNEVKQAADLDLDTTHYDYGLE